MRKQEANLRSHPNSLHEAAPTELLHDRHENAGAVEEGCHVDREHYRIVQYHPISARQLKLLAFLHSLTLLILFQRDVQRWLARVCPTGIVDADLQGRRGPSSENL